MFRRTVLAGWGDFGGRKGDREFSALRWCFGALWGGYRQQTDRVNTTFEASLNLRLAESGAKKRNKTKKEPNTNQRDLHLQSEKRGRFSFLKVHTHVRERYWSVAYGPLMRALAILVMSQVVPAIH